MGLHQPVELGGGRRPQEMEDQMGFAFHNIGELCPTLLGDSDLLLHSYETGSVKQENDFTFQTPPRGNSILLLHFRRLVLLIGTMISLFYFLGGSNLLFHC